MTEVVHTQPEWTKITVRPADTISLEDFEKAVKALKEANVQGPFVKLSSEGLVEWKEENVRRP